MSDPNEYLNEDHSPINTGKVSSGPFLATVVGYQDTGYMGSIEVEIFRPTSGNASEGQIIQAEYLNPFYGVTARPLKTDPNQNTYNNTQQSYGMWFVPPDVGSTVLVMFVDGNIKRAFWIGCVQDTNMNFMVPGIAATASTVEGVSTGGTSRAPTGEYNRSLNNASTDPEQFKKPQHPLTDVLTKQGLLNDDIRGLTTSSARRETPSMVFGISTPGPKDKRSGSRQGPAGKAEWLVNNAYLSRLGGTTFVMDDGDEHFIRMTAADAGPPIYEALEALPKGQAPKGDFTIPHNELVRIRTRTGHQILLHNSEDLIYIGNAKGTTWIELTSNGKIDIYAKDSISVHTENDLNFTADRDINFNAGGNVNINSGKSIFVTAETNYEIKAGKDGKLTVGGNTNIFSGGNHVETATRIDMNGPTAEQAQAALLPGRVPMVEPWAGHENLDPVNLSPGAPASSSPTQPSPSAFNVYTTPTDTFAKVKGKDR